jgi:hypothetical protein
VPGWTPLITAAILIVIGSTPRRSAVTTADPKQSTLVAFMSYSHHDDVDGRLSKFRDHLVQELRRQTGRDIKVFQDRDDIAVGERWQRRLAEGLAESTFLLPVVTPSFLTSDYCRDEYATFAEQEQALGRDDLVLPIYYIDCSHFEKGPRDDPAAVTLRSVFAHQYFDWRELRGKPPSAAPVQKERERLVKQIRGAMARVADQPPRPAIADQAAESTRIAGAPPQVQASDLASSSLDTVLDAIGHRDPVVSWPAAEELARRGPDAAAAAVDRIRGLTLPTVVVMRDLVGRFPAITGPLMLAKVANADSDWQGATQIPACLSATHRAVCEEPLAALLADSIARIDAVRKAIEGLGFIGAIDRAFHLARFLRDHAGGSDLYQKYSSYCVEALGACQRSPGPSGGVKTM